MGAILIPAIFWSNLWRIKSLESAATVVFKWKRELTPLIAASNKLSIVNYHSCKECWHGVVEKCNRRRHSRVLAEKPVLEMLTGEGGLEIATSLDLMHPIFILRFKPFMDSCHLLQDDNEPRSGESF